jgi:hypothetical protein
MRLLDITLAYFNTEYSNPECGYITRTDIVVAYTVNEIQFGGTITIDVPPSHYSTHNPLYALLRTHSCACTQIYT